MQVRAGRGPWALVKHHTQKETSLVLLEMDLSVGKSWPRGEQLALAQVGDCPPLPQGKAAQVFLPWRDISPTSVEGTLLPMEKGTVVAPTLR